MWRGGRRGEYGDFKHKASGVRQSAHRTAWLLSGRAIPDSAYVCHHCDNPICVRPDHLFLGDAAANARDMLSKGRGVIQRESNRGSGNGSALLSEDDVVEIKRLRGTVGQRMLARRFNVSASTIYMIHAEKTWSHVDIDMKPRLRSASGERNGRAKLSRADVDEIRELLGQYTPSEVADMFGVSRSSIYRIRSGEGWR